MKTKNTIFLISMSMSILGGIARADELSQCQANYATLMEKAGQLLMLYQASPGADPDTVAGATDSYQNWADSNVSNLPVCKYVVSKVIEYTGQVKAAMKGGEYPTVVLTPSSDSLPSGTVDVVATSSTPPATASSGASSATAPVTNAGAPTTSVVIVTDIGGAGGTSDSAPVSSQSLPIGSNAVITGSAQIAL